MKLVGSKVTIKDQYLKSFYTGVYYICNVSTCGKNYEVSLLPESTVTRYLPLGCMSSADYEIEHNTIYVRRWKLRRVFYTYSKILLRIDSHDGTVYFIG